MLRQLLTNYDALATIGILCLLASYILEQHPSSPLFMKVSAGSLIGLSLLSIAWAISLSAIRLGRRRMLTRFLGKKR